MTRQPRPNVFTKRKAKTRILKDRKERTDSQRRWLLRQINDPYVSLARDLGYRSRAAFKLLEIQDKYKILKPGYRVVDLGATPGGWSQVAATLVKAGSPRGGAVVALDMNPMDPIPHVTFLHGNFLDEGVPEKVKHELNGLVQVVLSDMAAPASGMTDVDHIRIIGLIEVALDFAEEVLAPGGSFVTKVLQGGAQGALLVRLKKMFKKIHHFKPPSSRKDSAEMFVVALGFRGQKGSDSIRS